MTWDKNKPSGGTKLRLADDMIRENQAAIEAALAEGHEFSTGGNQTGKHTTPTFVDNGADPAQPTATNEGTLYNNTGKFYYLTQAGVKRELGPIPPGTKMLFKQASAPAGWTFVAEDNDRALINTSTESQGGDTGGSWTIDGLSVDGHQLTVDEMPSHSHDFTEDWIDALGPGDGKSFTSGSGGRVDVYIAPTGGDQAHDHGISQDGSWRPSYAKVITCQKD